MDIKKIKRFTCKEDVDNILGTPKFQIGMRPVYYYGEGILVAYSAFQFKIVENSRIEYGEEGEYAVCVYHFADVDMLKAHFRIKEIEMENASKLREYRVDDDISYEYTFSDIQKVIKERKNMEIRKGETRVMVNGKMQVQNLFIMYEGYTLFFLGCSEKKRLSGFQYTLQE